MINLKFNIKLAEEFLDKVAGKLAFKIQRYLIEHYPKSFQNQIFVNKRGNTWIVGFNNEIMVYYESGTRPHEIKVKNFKALGFDWFKGPAIPSQPGKDGKYHFKKVKHPGTKGAHVLDHLEKNPQIVETMLEEAIRETIG